MVSYGAMFCSALVGHNAGEVHNDQSFIFVTKVQIAAYDLQKYVYSELKEQRALAEKRGSGLELEGS